LNQGLKPNTQRQGRIAISCM